MEKRTSRYEHLLWDIDGTLTDPAVGITTATQLALRRCGIEVEDRQSLCKFIGPPLMDSFRDFYGFTDVQAARACGYFREYYNVRGLFENVMYDGIDRLLDRLTEAGYKLYVATSKPDNIARQVLEHFDLARRFLFIGADTPEHLRPNKAAVVRYVIQSNHLEGELERTVMIGDRKHDVMGARGRYRLHRRTLRLRVGGGDARVRRHGNGAGCRLARAPAARQLTGSDCMQRD